MTVPGGSGQPDPRSPAEQALWPRIKHLGFVCQYHRQGYILDFYHPAARLAVEVDGRWHVQRREYDLRRDERFADVAIITLRVPAWRVFYELDGAVARVQQAVAQCKRRKEPAGRKHRDRAEHGLMPTLMREQFHVAKEASDAVRAFRAEWVSPFDTSNRGRITVVEPDAGPAAPQ